MGGKARVHELAKDFGVPVKEVLARLAADGEFVKSGSSTVEARVARRLRESFGAADPVPNASGGEAQRQAAGTALIRPKAGGGEPQRRAADTTSAQPRAAAGRRARQSSLLTSADALDIFRRHRLASTSEDPSQAFNELFRECKARYGISRSALRQVVASDKLRRLVADDARPVSVMDDAPRNLRDAKLSVGKQARPKQQPAGAAESAVGTTPTHPKTDSDKGKRRLAPITSPDAVDIYRRYRLASESENPSQAMDELARECEARYGLSQRGLQRIIAINQRRVPAKEFVPRNRRNPEPSLRSQKQPEKSQESDSAGAALSSSDSDGAVMTHPRARTPGLPPTVATMDVAAVADIVDAKISGVPDRAAIVTCLRQLAPNGPDGYGYLTWRYDATRAAHSEARLTAAHQELVALAVVIDHEKQLLDTLVRAHGSILTKPDLAERGLDKEFRDLTATTKGRSASAELRRTRAAFDFLRRAIVLAIANPKNDQRLWDMLGRIRPSTSECLETSPQLERATRRLTDLMATVERLLSTDSANLAQFFRHSRAHLIALQLKRYDFLRRFRDSAAGLMTASGQATTDVAFQVLPQGEQLRSFLGSMRTSKLYSGYRVDEHRLTVLEDLQHHFGAQRCVWHKGSGSSDGIGNRYLVLAIKSANGSGENAVAISPLAGRHATYVVRRECAEADWKTLFAHPKFEARLRGARKLLFTTSPGHTDQYSAMRDKIINLLDCPPREFRQRPVNVRRSRRGRSV